MSKQVLKLFFAIVLVTGLVWVAPVRGQEKPAITVEWIYSGESGRVAALPRYEWLTDNTAIRYDYRQPAEERIFEIFNPKSGQSKLAVDSKKALQSLTTFLGDDKTPKSLPWPLSFDNAGRQAVYLFNDDVFVLDLAAGQFTRVTDSKASETAVNFSPDGKMLAYVRENDLYAYDLTGKQEKRLTSDGSETLLNGTLSWVYWEEIFGRRDIGYWWSEDSKAIAFLQSDESPVTVSEFVDFKPYIAAIHKQRYPQAGGKNPVVRVGIVELADGVIKWLDFNAAPYEYLARVKWLPDSKQVSVQTMNRAQTALDLFFVDRATGKPRHILHEQDSAWVNINDDLYFLANGQYFIWASERDGYAHLYRYTMDGQLVNQITKGDWAIRAAGGGVYWLRQGMVAIDEKSDWIYFTALEKSSVEKHLYRIHMNGSGMQRLTREDGTHSITFSPDAKYYFDAYSNIRTLPALSLHRSDGKLAQTLAAPRPELLASFDMQYPELFTIPAADGFTMPAEIIKPKDFDPRKKYPVIFYVYGGPSAPTVADAWRSSLYFDEILVSKGYLVALVDNRAATAISKKLENLLNKRMSGEVELNDLVDAVKWMKAQPYVDPERVGIWGWSGGGSYTLNAMTNSTEFKAGIAVAAVSDWHYYDTKWAETAMKLPAENPEGYEKTSFVKTAKNLHGRLLLVHGTYDDNVHPQNAWAFIDALIRADIQFDLMIYPMRKHGISDRPARIHLYHRMVEFWEKNL